MSHTTTETIEIDDHEVKDGDACWFCSITADVEVESGTDHGDGGRTSHGSGPWTETEIDVDTVEAECVRINDKGDELETRELSGQAALDFTSSEDDLIQRAEDAHH